MISNPICLRVKGPFACFTRPEFKVERVSYLLEGRIEVADQISRWRGQRRLDFRGTLELLAKYHCSFLRRASNGQCAYQPFLACGGRVSPALSNMRD
jgi:CRISPR-associated protein (Cas_Cas5)